MIAGLILAAELYGSLTIRVANPAIRYSGRSLGIGTDTVTFGWSGARARLRFAGSKTVGIGADFHPNRAQSRLNAGELTGFLRDLMDWR